MRLTCQLYTLRDQLSTKPESTLENLSKTGLEYVELAGSAGLTFQKFHSLLNNLGLKVSGSHVGLAQLEQDPDLVIEQTQLVGAQSIILPWLDEKDRQDLGALAHRLQPIVERVQAAGLRFAYHNHDFEFRGSEPVLPIDRFLSAVPSMLAQLDLGWIHYAGKDPLEFLSRYAGRVDSVHLKDSRRGHSTMDVAPGEGELDFAKLITASEAAGAHFAAIEIDQPNDNPGEQVAEAVRFFNQYRLV